MQNIKWNGRAYPLESHVYNHRQAHDDLLESSARIQCAVPGLEQKVECLIDSIACTDRTLQESKGIIRANTNNMRENFEASHSSFIEVDHYRLSSSSASRNVDVSTVDFKASSGLSGFEIQ